MKEKPRQPVKLRLPPPGRARYEIDLPADAEVIIRSSGEFEVCAGRVDATTYRVWTRKVRQRKVSTRLPPEADDPNQYVDDEPSGGPP